MKRAERFERASTAMLCMQRQCWEPAMSSAKKPSRRLKQAPQARGAVR